MGRQDVSFDSGGVRCAAWLYPAEGAGPHPCVLLAHGFGGTRQARLWAFAERFQRAGISALVFDYRHFGDSEGEPRQLLSIGRQHEDWRAALAFARSLEQVDPERIALWGTSFSGGHVVRVAAEDGRIAAVVSQAPFTDGISALRAAGVKEALRLGVAGVLDGLAMVRGTAPHRIPIVNRAGRGGSMTQPGAFEGYRALFEDPSQFRNEAAGRVGLTLAGYAPARYASKLNCPLLVCVVAGDEVTPPEPARAMAGRAPRGELVEYAGAGHFDIYFGELFERAVADQTGFLAEHLGVPEPAAAAA